MSQSSQYKDEKDVASRIKGLLSPDDALSDTVLLCAGGAQLRAHSLVLALHSPVFHGLLAACAATRDPETGALHSSRPPVFEVDLSGAPVPCAEATVRRFLEWCYAGSCGAAASDREARELMYVSARLGAAVLRNSVEADVLRRYITRHSACLYLARAGEDDRMQAPSKEELAAATPTLIRAGSAAFVRANAAACFTTDAFFDLSLAAVAELAQDDALSIREEELFRQLHAWADAFAARKVGAGAGDARARKAQRAQLLEQLLPHIRFPLMGMNTFARVVVPYDAVPPADVAALLAYFSRTGSSNAAAAAAASAAATPLLALTASGAGSSLSASPTKATMASGVRFSETPRFKATGSVYTFASAPKPLVLSGDARTLQFSSAQLPANAADVSTAKNATLAVTEQAFAAGSHNVFLSLWGAARVVAGVVVSASELDEGDCASMAAESAFEASPSFEGLAISRNGAVAPLTHSASFKAAPAPAAGEATFGSLQDGDVIALALDYDLGRLDVSLMRPARKGRSASASFPIGSFSGFVGRPLRVAAGGSATGTGAAGDMDGIQISSRRP
jgi:hypothetical protein